MKKLLLILLCLPMIGFGQPYLDLTSTWIKSSGTASPGPITTSKTQLYITSTTVFGINTYFEMYSATNTTEYPLTGGSPILTTSNGGPSYLREDGFKWYTYNIATGVDELLYDFSLNVGDNIGSFYSVPGSPPVITSITYVTLFSTSVRKQFHLDNGYSFVEGVGFSPLIGFIEAYTNLDCYMQNNQNWGLGPDSLCSIITSSNISINPKKGELLKVTDLLGRETKGTKNEVLFYIYDDGTVEKRIVID